MSHRSLRGISRRFSRAYDEAATELYGVPSMVLMENAGRGAAEAIHRRFTRRFQRATCVCGPGNNGGDGLVVARHLLRLGWRVAVVLLREGERYPPRGDAGLNWRVVQRLGIPSAVWGSDVVELDQDQVLVDALFGTGLDRPLAPEAARLVRAQASSGNPQVAVDAPSGLDADTGEALGGLAVRADVTVTFVAAKRGLLAPHAAPFVGELEVADIGVPFPLPGWEFEG